MWSRFRGSLRKQMLLHLNLRRVNVRQQRHIRAARQRTRQIHTRITILNLCPKQRLPTHTELRATTAPTLQNQGGLARDLNAHQQPLPLVKVIAGVLEIDGGHGLMKKSLQSQGAISENTLHRIYLIEIVSFRHAAQCAKPHACCALRTVQYYWGTSGIYLANAARIFSFLSASLLLK